MKFIKNILSLAWFREQTADDLRRGFITEGDRLAVVHQATADHSAAIARMYRERSARLRAELAITADGQLLEVASPPMQTLPVIDRMAPVPETDGKGWKV